MWDFFCTICKQDIGIPMGINPTPFWANSFFTSVNLSILNNSFQMDLLNYLNITVFLGSLMNFVL